MGELDEAGLEVADSFAAGVSVERAGIEGGQVALDPGFRGGDLLLDGGEFAPVGVVFAGAVLPLGTDRLGDEVGVGVRVEQGGEDGVVEVGGG